jgi:nitrilase
MGENLHIAAPVGSWVVPPVIGKEELIIADLNFNRVLVERQNFDVSGHYSRPDVARLSVNRERQSILRFFENDHN